MTSVSELVREGEYWTVVFDERELRVRDSKGIGYLAELLAHPGREIPVLELARASSASRLSSAEAVDAQLRVAADSDAGPLLDETAKRSYRERLDELRAEIDQAEAFHDPERAVRARVELDAIVEQLAAATGLGGRDRRAGSAAERARLNVTRAVRAAIVRLAEHDRQLGEHLSACVRTGRVCVYRPDSEAQAAWSVTTRMPRRRPERRFRPPQTQYARSGDVSIAYQVLGDGPCDVVFVHGWLSHLDFQWTNPTLSRFFRKLASFCRLIVFDQRGAGLSDPLGVAPTLEERTDDIRAVMDAIGSQRAALIGYSYGGTISVLFAASYPERVASLVLYDAWAAGAEVSAGMPGAEQWKKAMGRVRETIEHWGEGQTLDWAAPSLANDPIQRRLWGTFERAAMSPGMAAALIDALNYADVRSILAAVSAPTLVLHHALAEVMPLEQGRYLAEHISGARFVQLSGTDHAPVGSEMETIGDEIKKFLTEPHALPAPDRVLATVLIADAVDASADTAPSVGVSDAELLGNEEAAEPAEIRRFGGRMIQQDGVGLAAAFDGPARAIRCAQRLSARMGESGVQLRVGVHSGECERVGSDLGGPAVRIGMRVSQLARPGEIVVSQTVKDLVIGSGIAFADRGSRELDGIPGEWRLYSVADDALPDFSERRFEVNATGPVAS